MNSFRAVERALRFEEARQRERSRSRPGDSRRRRAAGSKTGHHGLAADQGAGARLPLLPGAGPAAAAHRRVSMVDELRERLPELPAAGDAAVHRASMALGTADAASLTAERDDRRLLRGGRGRQRRRRTARGAANWIVNDLMGLQRDARLPPERVAADADAARRSARCAGQGHADRSARPRSCLPQIAAGRDAARGGGPAEPARRWTTRMPCRSGGRWRRWRHSRRRSTTTKSGKKAAIGRLIGETIKRTGGRANPDQVRRRFWKRSSRSGELRAVHGSSVRWTRQAAQGRMRSRRDGTWR